MADLSFLPPEAARLKPPGGAVRESVLVDVSAWPAVQRRRELGELLLSATCPFDEHRPWRFVAEDLPVLLTIVEERFDGAHALLRRQAVAALGTVDDEAARERLVGLALDPAEHDGIRIAAATALGPRGAALAERLADDPSAAIRLHSRRLKGEKEPHPRGKPGRVPVDTAGADDRPDAYPPGQGLGGSPAVISATPHYPSRLEMWIAILVAVIAVLVGVAALP